MSTSSNRGSWLTLITSVMMGSPVSRLASTQHLDSLSPKTLKRRGKSGFEAPPAKFGRLLPGRLWRPPGFAPDFPRSRGRHNEAEAAAANPEGTWEPGREMTVSWGRNSLAAALEGLRYPLYLLHNLQTGQQLYVHSACLAHQGESCVIFPGKRWACTLGFWASESGGQFGSGGSGFDDDDHMQFCDIVAGV